MVVAKFFVYDKKFEGFPKQENFKIIEQVLPSLKNGEYLAEAVYLSVDPYMRAHTESLKIGEAMIGGQVAKITESKNPKFPVGRHVVGYFGWRSHTIVDGNSNVSSEVRPATYLVPKFNGLPLSLALGVAGMPGNTAYFGFLEICKPKQGETVVVSGAGGAVGSHVGQIAKIKGCTVIGIAGSDTKGKWLKDELGFDYFINYKTENISATLKKYAPKGVDCYFDNVGGEISSAVMSQMNLFGRISVCGAISGYNEDTRVPSPFPYIVGKQLMLEGFLVTKWGDRWREGIESNLNWIKEGKLKYKETVTEGFDNMAKAFIDMLQGENIGKAIIKV